MFSFDISILKREPVPTVTAYNTQNNGEVENGKNDSKAGSNNQVGTTNTSEQGSKTDVATEETYDSNQETITSTNVFDTDATDDNKQKKERKESEYDQLQQLNYWLLAIPAALVSLLIVLYLILKIKMR